MPERGEKRKKKKDKYKKKKENPYKKGGKYRSQNIKIKKSEKK